MRGRDLVFEIGTEELPSGAALRRHRAAASRGAARRSTTRASSTATSRVFGSPRRLVLLVSELAERQDDRHRSAQGPGGARPRSTPTASPTKAAEGFARGKGVAVERPRGRRRRAGGAYVYATVEVTGVAGGRRAAGAARAARRGHRLAEVDALGERRRALLAPGALAARAVRRRRRAGRVRRARRPAASRTATASSRPGRSRSPSRRRVPRARSSAARSCSTSTSARATASREGIDAGRASARRRARSCPRRRSPRS